MTDRPAADPIPSRRSSVAADSTVPPPPPPSPAARQSGRDRGRRRAWSIGPPAHLLGQAGEEARTGAEADAEGDASTSPSHSQRGATGERQSASWREARMLRTFLGS